MFGFILSPLGRSLALTLAAVAILTATHWKAYQAGAASERAAILSRSVEVLRERNATDDEVSSFDDMALCRALGGVWMLSDGTCQ
jgi:hypothetical protein